MSQENLNDEKQNSIKKTVLELHGFTPGKIIGNGTYAKVKLAYSEEFKCSVAVKIISKTKAPREYLGKFLPRELDVVRGLHHENLIRFYQSIETTHRVYLIMQYAENGSLLDLIRRHGYLIEDLSRKYFRQLVNVTDYCHSQGVVHRDIKCENLLLDRNYDLKIIDFGFARKNMKPVNNRPILSETYCGSYAYASPEILKGIPYDPRYSDCWATGVVLYAMVFGRLPFDGTNYQNLLKQVQSKVLFPKEPDASTACKSLIQKILAPLKTRLNLKLVKKEPWFKEPIRQTIVEEFLAREELKTRRPIQETKTIVDQVKMACPVSTIKLEQDKQKSPSTAASFNQTQAQTPTDNFENFSNNSKNTNGTGETTNNVEKPNPTSTQYTDNETKIEYPKLTTLNKTEEISPTPLPDRIDTTPKNPLTPSITTETPEIVTEIIKNNGIIENKGIETAVNSITDEDTLVHSKEALFKEISGEGGKLQEEETKKNAVAV